MNRLDWLFVSVILNMLFSVMLGDCSREKPTLKDNCTCETNKGTYSLFPLQRTDGCPRFYTSHQGYTYTFNPCKPYSLLSPKKTSCKNVALCKYDTDGSPHVYIDIGEQRDVQCQENADGKTITLIYPVKNPDVPGDSSKVILECNDNSEAEPDFHVINPGKMIFNLTSYCGCPNRCLPTTPVPTKPPGVKDWELKILLPSLLAASLVVVIICLWKRLSVIQRALLCRCFHCHDQNRDPPGDERIAPSTENSPLINNHENDRAVEHEYTGAKGKLKEPVQEEEGDVGGKYKFPGNDYRTVVI